MNLKEWLQLILLSILWGGSFFFVGIAVKALPPFNIVTLRVGIAALILWPVMLLLNTKLDFSIKVWRTFVIMGLLNNVLPFSLIVWGQTQITSGLASILNATTPLFTVIIAGIFLNDEKITWYRIVGVILGFIGVAILLGFEILKNLNMATIAQLLIILAAIFYGFAGVYGRRFKKMGIAPLFTATGQLTASSLIMLPLAIMQDDFTGIWPMEQGTVFSIVGLAAFSTSLAYLIYFQILSSAGATNLLLVTFLIPVSAILLGYFFLQEILMPNHFVGMFVIGLGLVAMDGRFLWVLKN